jgi:uncharacterized protein (TIGR01777 family)
MPSTFRRRDRLAHDAATVFDWLSRPGALARMLPPWDGTKLVEKTGGLEAGARVVLSVKAGPFRRRWVAVHTDYEPERMRFRDEQVRGPFALWRHTHAVEPDGPDTSRLIDEIEWALPLHPLAAPLAGRAVSAKIGSVFAYRHRIMAGDLEAHGRLAGREPMHVLLSGASGLVGSALTPYLTTGGHTVSPLVRPGRPTGKHGVAWNPATGELGESAGGPADAVVHLAGESVAEGRWTSAKKARLRGSRVEPTRLLCERLAALPSPPRVIVSASAIGIYGDRTDAPLTEESEPGGSFLSQLARDWESATEPAREAGIRVVNLRIGIVLSPSGGALAKMLAPFRLGAGGPLGHGRQYMSWIALDDLLDVILFCLAHEDVAGPVNAVGPDPVPNREFTRTLARVLRRPAFLPAPAFALRLALGEMADELLLGSQRVVPERLTRAGFSFRFPRLEDALRHMLGK